MMLGQASTSSQALGMKTCSRNKARVQFIEKVYGIVAMQLLLTFMVAGTCTFSVSVQQLLIRVGDVWFGRLVTLPTFASLLFLHCFKQSYPMNYALLLIFTLGISLNLGMVCAALVVEGMAPLILQAIGLTAAIFVALSAYAHTAKSDFS